VNTTESPIVIVHFARLFTVSQVLEKPYTVLSGTRLYTNITTEMRYILPKKNIKISHRRVFVSGNIVEVYDYEKAYSYNWEPQKRNGGGDFADSSPIDGELGTEGTPDPSLRSGTVTGERRADNLYRARARLRRLISANESAWGQVPKFVTYTFRENVTNYKEAVSCWTRYQRKLRTSFGKQKYICIVEFQKRGAVHFHVVHFSIPFTHDLKNRLWEMWGYGFIQVKAIRDIRSLGLYVSKYLRKGLIDDRLISRRAYLSSRDLVQPVLYRDERNIDNLLSSNKIDYVSEFRFESGRLGKAVYKLGKIIQ